MTESSGRVVGKMKWLVTRYPKAPGQLIVLGAILSDPEEPESCLNRGAIKPVPPDQILDESAAVQRTIQAEAHKDDSALLKVAQPLLGAGITVGGKLVRDRKTVLDALDVKAKIFLPDLAYMKDSVAAATGVQDYVKKSRFAKTLYMVMGVASANKLSVEEETARERAVELSGTVDPAAGATDTQLTAEGRHEDTKKAVSKLKIEEECDFAYRIREFTYWRHKTKKDKEKIKMKDDRSVGSLFNPGVDGDDDAGDDDDEEEYEAVFNHFKEEDVKGSASGGLVTLEI